jgi:PrtD family type I secretion system ABC transporter
MLFAFVFHAFTNVLLLAYPVFMIHVYERVVPSKSLETLVALFLGLCLAVIANAVFQWVRGVLFIRAATRLDARLADRLLEALLHRTGRGQGDGTTQALRDLDAFRQFATSKGALAAMDAPWGIFFLGVMVAMSPAIGVVAIGCMVVLAAATVVNSTITKRALLSANHSGNSSYHFADTIVRASEAVVGMGMVGAAARRWRRYRDEALHQQTIASQRGALLTSFLGSARLLMQGIIMSVGAIQMINGSIAGGVAMAMMFVFGFAMKPIDQLIGAWEEYHPIKESMRRIDATLASAPAQVSGLQLPRPAGRLTCENVSLLVRGQDKPILRGISFEVEPGTALGLIGLNGSGKTTLARMLVGAMPPTHGTIRLDGADLQSWDREELGKHVGYLPQNIGLLSGTVADNIGRFGSFDDKAIIAAATLAGAHDLILRLPKGYDTEMGEAGFMLSGGQRQLIALARAVVGNPSLVILDEPNSNLDGPGEEALINCVRELKKAGTTVVLITHRPNLVVHLDRAAALRDGVLASFGTTSEIFKQIGRPIIVKKTGTDDA